MTSPNPLGIPATVVDATPANPHTSGLYTAATVLDSPDTERIGYGIEVIPVNCGGHGTWPAGCDPEVPDELVKEGARPATEKFPAIVTWAVDQCSLVGSNNTDGEQRANQLLRLYEQIDVEDDVAPRLLAAAGTPATVPTGADALARALGAVELAIGLTGMVGVIHASRALAPLFHDHIVVGQAGKLTTKLGNVWAFGAGYGDLGNTIVGTGPVTVRRGTVLTKSAIDARQNERISLAEREVAVSWECAAVAQNIA